MSKPTEEEKGATTSLTNFEKRIIELAKQFPKGIPDKIVQSDMPEISGAERAQAINNLLSLGLVDLYKQGNDLLYKVKTQRSEPVQMKDADSEEKVVFDIIGEAGNKGIWIRDIRFKCNLTQPQLMKILKALENKRLIKGVKSVSASKKKVYMLFDLEPDRSLTGGAWYSDQDFESEFVYILNQQCLRFLNDKQDQGRAMVSEIGPKAAKLMSSASLDDIWKFINQLGISKVALTPEDIEDILDTLIFDGKVERIYKGDLVLFLSVEPFGGSAGLVCTPCGICPVAKKCSERGVVNPKSCVYMSQWLSDA